MGLPSNQGNIFYWARPLITMKKERERGRGGPSSERRLGVGWCFRCYVWLFWAHLFFPFDTFLFFFPLHLSLSIHCSKFSSLSFAHNSLSSFLSFPLCGGSCISPFFLSLFLRPPSFSFLLLSSRVCMCVCVNHVDFITVICLLQSVERWERMYFAMQV